MTMAKMAIRISATRSHWNKLSAASSAMPIPPAPTNPEHRGLAHVDVPAEQRDRPERGPHLRPVTEGHPRHPRRAGGRQRLDGPRLRLLERLAEQLADEADRAEGDGQRAGQRAGAENADEEQRPDQRVDRARRHQDQLCEQVDRRERHQVVGGEDSDGKCQHQREQRAQRSRCGWFPAAPNARCPSSAPSPPATSARRGPRPAPAHPPGTRE